MVSTLNGVANEVVAFDHGAGTESPNFRWPSRRDREFRGSYYPADAPKFFFETVDLPAGATKSMFDPTYCLPLYETVPRDSVVNLHRWELSHNKATTRMSARARSWRCPHNTPPNVRLDAPTLKRHAPELAKP